jgi:eukaryotic-like serine/threonine-protein kinase
MRSDSVASFLNLARENRLLEPEQFDDLFRQPDVPQSGLAALCDFLLSRKVLTPYQADLIRAGRGYELSFAGYPVYADLGPCPGGTAYRVAHPSLRTPLVLRRLRADWLAPADNVAAYVQRAQAACPVVNPHLCHLLDAGVHRDEPFVVLEPSDGADLQSLIADIGPMPVALAVEYLRQAARGLAEAHARGLPHGDLRPKHLAVGPLVASSRVRADGTPRMRPASSATVQVTEFGLIPRRPAGADFPDADPAYLPPERAADGTATLAGDVFMLGGCLHYLLTGQAPGPAPLAAARIDVPADLADLVEAMVAAEPDARPSVVAVLVRLDAISPPATVPPPPPPAAGTSSILPEGPPVATVLDVTLVAGESGVVLDEPPPVDGEPVSLTSSVELVPPAAPGGWAAYAPPAEAAQPMTGFGEPAAEWSPPPFVPSEYEESRTAPGYNPAEDGVSMRRRPRPPAPGTNKKLWMWLGIGVALQVLAVVLWVMLFSGGADPDPDPKAKPVQPKPNKPKKGST